jgi:hypothetical protein
LKNGEGAKKIC